MNTLTPEGLKLIDSLVATHDDEVRAAERERCAQTARRIGANLDEPAIGNAIAQAILNRKE